MTVDKRPASWWTVLTWFTVVLVALACGVIVWSFMPPVVFFPVFALASAVLATLGAVWLVLGLIGWIKYRALRLSAVAPALVLITLTLVMVSVPSRVAFAVSKDSLAAVAVDCQKSLDAQRIGVYRVVQIWPDSNGCRFQIEGGLLNSIGLAYLPDGAPYLGEPRSDGDIVYEEFDGDWYVFVRGF
ncbi:hypothetical protein B2J88_14740 [Rhodococcus sp. SRB_17]|uniref:hypothetical protein n=1 Tax=Rhodococcus sp. OK302 TaxID=1882769 RepID=UPI000B93E76A|nr:hypothetical protein [Rhodococcus sp. OK302]NMM85612.1 hypothetical protein [Rhodococcus sp. SRB_17]OYD70240.1 hypothetical protein BDB13_3838 [Rhodococcus sp. OK302]